MAAAAEFTINHRFEGAKVTVKVLIYETRKAMARAAQRATGQRFDDAAGICTDTRGGNPHSTIRLNLETLHAPLMVHETVHAAMNVYRRRHLADPATLLLPEDAHHHFRPDNELFAHLVSDLYTGLQTGLDDAGYRIVYNADMETPE
jgi:hypothetical protein